MAAYYAMVLFRALIDGTPTGSLDLSAFYYDAESEDEVLARIEGDEPLTYRGAEGDEVTWELVRILSIDACHDLDSGDEVTGIIVERGEWAELLDPD